MTVVNSPIGARRPSFQKTVFAFPSVSLPSYNQTMPSPLPTKIADEGGVSRYADVAQSLIQEITGGRYVVGALLPTELELAQYYGVSRQTVRAALAILNDRGYISKKKAVGSRVESTEPDVGYTQSVSTIEDLVRVASTEVRSVQTVSSVTLDRASTRRLGAPLGSEWTLFSGPRVDEKTNGAVSWADIYVSSRFSGIEDEVMSSPRAMVSKIIERNFGLVVEEIWQSVFGTLVASPLSSTLGVPEGSAGLRILRHYRDGQGKILEITETIYPADRINVSFQLRRSKIRP
jgi:GntR family transcriptional regulator